MQEKTREDTFFWLISEIRAVLLWAHEHALREAVYCADVGETYKKRVSNKTVEDIIAYIGRDDKKLFRIILRKGMNRLLALDNQRQSDILDICIFCVEIETKFYYVNIYISAGLLTKLKRKFSLIEDN